MAEFNLIHDDVSKWSVINAACSKSNRYNFFTYKCEEAYVIQIASGDDTDLCRHIPKFPVKYDKKRLEYAKAEFAVKCVILHVGSCRTSH